MGKIKDKQKSDFTPTEIDKLLGCDFIADIESYVMYEVGEQFKKRLKHQPNLHPQSNSLGLVVINGEYFKWEYF